MNLPSLCRSQDLPWATLRRACPCPATPAPTTPLTDPRTSTSARAVQPASAPAPLGALGNVYPPPNSWVADITLFISWNKIRPWSGEGGSGGCTTWKGRNTSRGTSSTEKGAEGVGRRREQREWGEAGGRTARAGDRDEDPSEMVEGGPRETRTRRHSQDSREVTWARSKPQRQ